MNEACRQDAKPSNPSAETTEIAELYSNLHNLAEESEFDTKMEGTPTYRKTVSKLALLVTP